MVSFNTVPEGTGSQFQGDYTTHFGGVDQHSRIQICHPANCVRPNATASLPAILPSTARLPAPCKHLQPYRVSMVCGASRPQPVELSLVFMLCRFMLFGKKGGKEGSFPAAC